MKKNVYLSLLSICALLQEAFGTLSENDIGKSSNLHVRKKRLIDLSVGRVYPARLQDFPYMVHINKNGHQICGGVILSPHVILSAAHCLSGDPNATYTVVSGSAHLNTGITHIVARYLMHPHYYPKDKHHDLVMLVISPAIDFKHSHNKNIVLYEGHSIEPGELCFICGWGCTNNGRLFAPTNVLLSIVVPVLSEEECSVANSKHTTISNTEICTYDRLGQRCSSHGDSGNPLTINDRLLGILAWGPGFEVGKNPDVFMNVTNSLYRNWILAYLRHIEMTTRRAG